jgi:hypothetical protein
MNNLGNIVVNFDQDSVANTHNNFSEKQTDRGLINRTASIN